MKPGMRDVAIGLTALGGVAGLTVILLMFGELARFTETYYSVEYRLNTAEGLVRGSKVKLNGVPVGQVRDMQPLVHPERGVLISVRMNSGTLVPREAHVSIQTGLLGEGSLSLTSPEVEPGRPAPQMLKEGDLVVARAETVFEQIGAAVAQELGDFRTAAKSVTKLGETYTSVGERVQELLAARPTREVDAGGATPTLATVIERLDRAIAGADAWLGDAELRGGAKEAVAKFAGVVDDAKATLASIRSAADGLKAQSDALAPKADAALVEIRRAADGLSETLAEARTLLVRANAGEGTLGQLSTNPDLYRSMVDAVNRLEAALTQGQLLIEKWKAEGLPIQF
jgi:ABC-type transporter Mla subunit MlaD